MVSPARGILNDRCFPPAMSVAYKDYYKILGVARDASADEIRKAFRKLAAKYHPDRHHGDKAMEEKFKEITRPTRS